MKKKIILFDIDYTLFNAQLFREAFYEALAKHIPHTHKEALLRTLEEVYETAKTETSFFDPVSFLDLLGKKIPFKNQAELEKAIMQKDILESALYKETKEVLETLAKEKNVVLGIFSWGNIPTQKAKIRLLNSYFQEEHVHVVEIDKRTVLPELLDKYKHHTVYLVDDYQEVLAKAKKVHPDLRAIWIKRPETEGKESRIFANFAPDSIISNLKEIIPLIHQ